jgi:hypothetical protein
VDRARAVRRAGLLAAEQHGTPVSQYDTRGRSALQGPAVGIRGLTLDIRPVLPSIGLPTLILHRSGDPRIVGRASS